MIIRMLLFNIYYITWDGVKMSDLLWDYADWRAPRSLSIRVPDKGTTFFLGVAGISFNIFAELRGFHPFSHYMRLSRNPGVREGDRNIGPPDIDIPDTIGFQQKLATLKFHH